MKWIAGLILASSVCLRVSAAEEANSQQVVCHIAAEYLDEATRMKLEPLAGAPFTKEAFVELCSRPLEIRGARSGKLKFLQDDSEGSVAGAEGQSQVAIRATRNLPLIGYMDLLRGAAGITGFDCPEADTCLLKALMEDTETLMDRGAEASARLTAINRISWHMARLHFPFSFGFEDDQGGHWVRVGDVGSCARNLNDFWAKCTFELGAKARGVGKKDVARYAAVLRTEIQPNLAQKWIAGSNLLAWANQSYRIATNTRTGYCVWKKDQCRYSEEKLKFDPDGQLYDQNSRKTFVGKTEGVATQEFGVNSMTYKKLLLDDEYKRWATAVTETRLKQAGVRLAAFLAASL